MATLITLECTSDCGTVPERTAGRDELGQEPAILRLGARPASITVAVGRRRAVAVPGRRAAGAADPPRPFQEVSSPGAHQLPVKLNRAPPANSTITWAVAYRRTSSTAG